MPIRSMVTLETGVVIDYPELVNLYECQPEAEETFNTSDLGGMTLLTLTENRLYDVIPWIFFAGQINSHFLRTDSSTWQIRS